MDKSNQITKMLQLCELMNNNTYNRRDFLMEKIGISRRSFFRYMDELRDAGANIVYIKSSNTYKLLNSFSYVEYLMQNIR